MDPYRRRRIMHSVANHERHVHRPAESTIATAPRYRFNTNVFPFGVTPLVHKQASKQASASQRKVHRSSGAHVNREIGAYTHETKHRDNGGLTIPLNSNDACIDTANFFLLTCDSTQDTKLFPMHQIRKVEILSAKGRTSISSHSLLL
jgi:hypothetical protein